MQSGSRTARARSTVNQFNKTVYIPQPPQQAFAVVNDIEAYPEFVPWCSNAQIISRESGVVVSQPLLQGRLENTAIHHTQYIHALQRR